MKAESWRCNGPVCLYAYVPAEGSRTMCFYIYYYFSFLYGERQRQTFAFGQIYNSLQLRKYMFKTKFHNNNKYLEDSEWVCFVWKHWIYCRVYTEAIMHLFPNSQIFSKVWFPAFYLTYLHLDTSFQTNAWKWTLCETRNNGIRKSAIYASWTSEVWDKIYYHLYDCFSQVSEIWFHSNVW